MMAMNGKTRGRVWFQWGCWWWRIERPGLVLDRSWAGFEDAGEAGDDVRAEMRERRVALRDDDGWVTT